MTSRPNASLRDKPRAARLDARMQTVRMLGELERGRKTLDALMEAMERSAAFEDSRDRDLLHALLFGVLRWRGRLDHIIAHFSKIPLAKIDPTILNILRTGLFQLLYLTRIPPSAAVHTAVDMAKTVNAPWVASFVNAVLRRAAANHPRVAFPDIGSAPVQSLTAQHSFPEWLAAKWIGRYGLEATGLLCDAINTIPPLTLRVNTLRVSRAELSAALESDAEDVRPAALAPEGIHVQNLRRRLTDLAAFQHGWFQVQDEAAQLVSRLLDPRPGEKVLDACAGRGGKTGHLAQLMQHRGELVALDTSAERLAQLQAELQRLEIANVAIRRVDPEGPALGDLRECFDRILVDAPCSGLGTLRRNPDIKWSACQQDLWHHHHTQLKLIERSSAYLKPGGVLVYSVCSPEPEETTEVVAAFLATQPAFRIDCGLAVPEPIGRLLDHSGFLQTYPHLRYMDGFCAVRLRRTI